MRTYEGAFIFEDVSDRAVFGERLKAAEALIAKHNGTIVDRHDLGHRVLGYPIRGKGEGHVVVLDFNLPSDALGPVDQALRMVEGLLRASVFVKHPRRPSRARKRAEQVLGADSHGSKP